LANGSREGAIGRRSMDYHTEIKKYVGVLRCL